MQSSTIILAGIFGPVIFLAALAMLLRRKIFTELLKFFKTQRHSSFILIGLALVALSLSLVQYHNYWDGLAEILVSLIIWGLLVRGILLLFFPDVVRVMSFILLKKRVYYRIATVLGIVAGGYLSYVGYFL